MYGRFARVKHTVSAVAFLSILAVPSARPALAQDSVVVRDDGRCRGCGVSLHQVVEIGDVQGPGRLDHTLASWARDSRGRVLLAGGWDARVRVFGPDGRFLRALEPPAQPDSLPVIVGLVAAAPGDSVHLVDEVRGLHLVLDADYRPARTAGAVPVRPASLRLLLPGGGAVAAGSLPTRDNAGFPLHLIGADGSVTRSFGTDAPEDVPGQGMELRKLAVAGPSAVWAGDVTRYRIERWSLSGAREAALVRDVPWFRPYTSMRWTEGEAPHPILMAIRQDSAGRLWTLARVADARWRSARPLVNDTALARRNPAARYDPDDLYDTMLEAIDPACGRVLVSERLPRLFAGFLDDTHLLSWSDRPGAHPRATVWRLDVTLPPASRGTDCGSQVTTARRR